MKTTLFLLLAGVVACGGGNGGGGDAGGDGFDRQALLASWGEHVIVPVLRELDAAAGEMSVAVAAYCDAVGTGGEAAALEDARAGWRAAMVQVQLAEVMQIGPAAMNDKQVRSRIYSWPTVSSCAVDQDVETYRLDPGSYDISGRLNNRRGMDALDYVLHAPSLDHSCPDTIAPAGWNELADADRLAARCGYATVAAADVAATASALLQAWVPEGGNYLAELAAAGDSGNSFSSAQEALNVVSDAMFYVEVEVKDMKLAAPAGITDNSCGAIQEPCLAELESSFADHNKENVVANLRGFQMLLLGEGPAGGELGFDDMLVELGAPELAATMTADLEAAIAAAEAVPGTMGQALADDYEAVVASHTAIKLVTDNLKSQFVAILGLDIPDASAGDND